MKLSTRIGVLTLIVPTILSMRACELVDRKDLKEQEITIVTSSDIKKELTNFENYLSNLLPPIDLSITKETKISTMDINILNDLFEQDKFVLHSDSFDIDSSLKKQIEQIVASFDKDVSFYVISLDKKISFGYNPDKKYSAASSIKAPFALSCYKNIESGNSNLGDIVVYDKNCRINGTGVMQNSQYGNYTIEQLLTNTIHHSDNVAYTMLYNYYGVEGYNKMLDELGCSYLKLTTASQWGFASPKEFALVWNEINNYQNTEIGGNFFELLTNARYNFLKGSLTNYEIAHKSGYSDRGYNDSGIVFADTPYIISIMTSYPEEYDGHELVFDKIAKISDEIMSQYNKYLEENNKQLVK